MTAKIKILPDESTVVDVLDDPEIPDAPISYDGDRPAAWCPTCGAMVLLWRWVDNDVSEYELHWVNEHRSDS